ncbi:MAG: hypothetical protein AAFV80_16855, partial [Bacteroidota bacterium]
VLIFEFILRVRLNWIHQYLKSWTRRYLLTTKAILLFNGRKWIRIPLKHVRDIGFSMLDEENGNILLALSYQPNERDIDLSNGFRKDFPSLQYLSNVKVQHNELKKQWKIARMALN